ncbi:MAG: hypothetical protein IID33_05735 [Planctomycetes bacterium]|nr:hypothetical protein [Planctomycetota bacterium]
MRILADKHDPPAAVHAVREVRIGIPIERRREVSDFYTGIIGLPQWPARESLPGGWCAGSPRRGVYFAYRNDADVDAMRRRFTVLVPSLDDIEEKLRDSDRPFQRLRGLSYAEQRILVADPIGHLVELRQCQPL